jgi:hypothetical protein
MPLAIVRMSTEFGTVFGLYGYGFYEIANGLKNQVL